MPILIYSSATSPKPERTNPASMPNAPKGVTIYAHVNGTKTVVKS